MEQYLDPAEWPRWFHHASRESILCKTPDDVAELPAGYRKQPWSEEEKYQHARNKQAEAEVLRKSKAIALEAELDEPVPDDDKEDDLQAPVAAYFLDLARPVDEEEAEELAPPPAPPRIEYKRPSRAKPQPRVRTPIRYGQPRKP